MRQGLLEAAILAAYELYRTSEQAEDLLWERLALMAAEDVGLGNPTLPAVIEALYATRCRLARSGDRWLLAAHAVRLLVTSDKDRTSAELADWATVVTQTGERRAEMLDVAIDMHTERGVAMGRGREHFYRQGNAVAREIGDRDLTWLTYLREHAR